MLRALHLQGASSLHETKCNVKYTTISYDKILSKTQRHDVYDQRN